MKCIYCGKETEKNKYTIRVNKGAEEVQCCGRECYLKTRKFIDADNSKKKLLFYIIAAVLVVINLFVLGYKLQVWWIVYANDWTWSNRGCTAIYVLYTILL